MKKIITFIVSLCLSQVFTYAQDGSLDLTFNSTGYVTTSFESGAAFANSIAIQNDGKIVVAGSANNGSNDDFAVVRYNSNGTLDSDFGSEGKVVTAIGSGVDEGQAVAIQSDGKIIVAGYTHNGSNYDFALVRYNTNGALDAGFGTSGKVITAIGAGNDLCNSVAIQNDGKIVATGYSRSGSYNVFATVRYNIDGTLDADFGTGGIVTTDIGTKNDQASAVKIQSDGNIVVVGSTMSTQQDIAVVRYTSSGALDGAFGTGGIVTVSLVTGTDYGSAAAIQNDGKIVIAGSSLNDFALVRLNSNGSLDTDFDSDGKVTTSIETHNYACGVAVQDDGKIIAAGYSDDGTNYHIAVARYNSNGNLDNNFGTGGKVVTDIAGGDEMGLGMALQNDDKIVVAGSFFSDTDYDFAVVRYNNTPTESFANVVFVKEDGNDSNDGHSWANAKATIQAAIDASNITGCIIVKYGTYSITSQINITKTLLITSDNGYHTSYESAVPDSSQCIITASGCRVLYTPSTITLYLKGFKISNGDATSASTYAGEGGGAYFDINYFTLSNCWITGNTGSATGAGMGGGIYLTSTGGDVTISNCRFDNNIASSSSTLSRGGAVFVQSGISSFTFSNNFISHNTGCMNGNGLGGGVYVYSTSSTIENNIFVSNYASQTTDASKTSCQGGAIWSWSNMDIFNNTFYKNVKSLVTGFPGSSQGGGSAIYIQSGTPDIRNNIFSTHNVNASDTRETLYSSPAITISYNCFYDNICNYNGNVTSNHEYTSDPLFTNAEGGDFTLASSSNLIDAGDPSFPVPEGGEPAIDIGAEECINTSTTNWSNVSDFFPDITGGGISLKAQAGTIGASVCQNLNDPPSAPAGSRHIGKYWNISSITGGNAKIRLYYCNEAASSFTSTPTIYHYTGSSWESLPTEPAVTVGCCKYVETTNYYSSFSNVTVSDGAAPLPVELQRLSASVNHNAVTLNWETSTEVNNFGFEIERRKTNDKKSHSSTVNSNWEKLGFVEGHGNSNSLKNYSFKDEKISSGKYYYRLKQIDNDGSSKYSNEIEVVVNVPLRFALKQNYPNPFNPLTVISYQLPADSHVLLKVYNVLGEEVRTLVNENKKAGAYTFSFEVSGLSSGVYIYKMIAGKFSDVKKMVILK